MSAKAKSAQRTSTAALIARTRKRFNSTIKAEISISPAHLSVLERLIMDPLKQAAAEEKRARQKLRPASKALAEIKKMSAADRQKRIIESTLRRVASNELTRAAMCIINAPKLRAGASTTECKELVRKALLQDPVFIKTGGSRKGVTQCSPRKAEVK